MDNGPIEKSAVFRRAMEHLGIAVLPHLPAGKDGRRPTARSKGKVERPFRTVKEAHETLYHFHKPETEAEANRWLKRYLAQYNAQRHRAEAHSRIEDWLKNLPADGVREMCSWERFCAFAREPERRQVGGDARISVGGTLYEVDADLAGETVLLWWGLLDQDLYVEFGDERYGPYHPAGGPIPLHHYRQHRKGWREQRADRVALLARAMQVPKAVLEGYPALASEPALPPRRAFVDPDPFREFAFSNRITAKLAIAEALGMPLARLPEEERAFIDAVVAETLERRMVMERVMTRLRRRAVDRVGGTPQAAQRPAAAEYGGDRLPLRCLSVRGHGRSPGRLYRLAARALPDGERRTGDNHRAGGD
jgi:hypothetical protein